MGLLQMGEGANVDRVSNRTGVYFHKGINTHSRADTTNPGEGGIGIYDGIISDGYGFLYGYGFRLDDSYSGIHEHRKIPPLQDRMGLDQFTP